MDMQYDNRYILGFSEMDIQHQYLYTLFDLIEESGEVTDNNKMDLILKEIERYLNYHFTCEEHLMRLYDAPDFALHQSDHEAAALKFIGFLDDFERNSLNPFALRIFLTGWLMEHSKVSDSKYVQWIHKKRSVVGSVK